MEKLGYCKNKDSMNYKTAVIEGGNRFTEDIEKKLITLPNSM
jgi:hypothetical protein